MIDAMIWLGKASDFGADRSSLRRAQSAWLYVSPAEETMLVPALPPLIIAKAKALMADERAMLFPPDARAGRTSTQAPQTRVGGTPPPLPRPRFASGTKLRTTTVMRWSSGAANGRGTPDDAASPRPGLSCRLSFGRQFPLTPPVDDGRSLPLRCPPTVHPCGTNVQSDGYPGQLRPRKTHCVHAGCLPSHCPGVSELMRFRRLTQHRGCRQRTYTNLSFPAGLAYGFAFDLHGSPMAHEETTIS